MRLKLEDLKERNYQNIILEYLEKENGYKVGTNKDYDRYYAIDQKKLFEFLNETQPKEMEKLRGVYKSGFELKLIERINGEIEKYGLIEVLKKGFKDRGQKIQLMYTKPNTGINKDIVGLYEKNILSVTEEVVYTEKGRVDLVIFLNGLPIITFELKNNISGQNVKNAKEQYMVDRDPKDKLFRFNERSIVHFAMDTEEVYMATRLKKRSTVFLPFNKGDNGGKGNPTVEGKLKVSYMWEDILRKDTLLYLIDKFVYVQEKEVKIEGKRKGVKEKNIIFPRYHQIDVVREVTKDVLKNRTSRNYLIRHSAGSGKTNSIAWLSHRLMDLHEGDKNIFDSIIIITDRTVVDKQLQNAVTALDHREGTIAIITESSSQLAKEIQDGTKIIVSTIQKFRYILDKLTKLKGRNFGVIIDEAHSSTAGKNMEAVTQALTQDEARVLDDEIEEKDIEDEIIEEISRNGKQENIAMFAFTATPKPSTIEMFGGFNEGSEKKEAFHLYSMRQAIEEGFILDVLKNYITYKTYFEVSQTVQDDPKLAKSRTKRQIARYRDIHPTNISQKVEIIVEHFKTNVMHKIGGKAKAMVITSSRESAVKYKLAFEKYINEKGYGGIKALVAFTGAVNIKGLDIEYTEKSMNGFNEEELPSKFASADYNVLLVADKYQTGFDEPLLHTMYIDKKLRGVKAVQTLSRLNRVCEGKDDTFILDFKNDIEDIKKAFATFYENTSLVQSLNPNVIYDLEKKIDEYDILEMKDIEKFIKKAYKEVKTTKENQQQFSYVSKALDKSKKYSTEEQLELRSIINKFIHLYSLIIQISEFEDVELHKKYIFLKFLVKALNIETDKFIDISDKISLSNFKQVKDKEIIGEGMQGVEGTGGAMKHTTSLKTSIGEETYESLSGIIEEINEVFGYDFGDNEKLATLQIEEILKKSDELEKRAKNNTLDDFKYIFTKAFEESIVEGLSRNKDFFEMLISNEALNSKLMEFMIERVYADFQEKR